MRRPRTFNGRSPKPGILAARSELRCRTAPAAEPQPAQNQQRREQHQCSQWNAKPCNFLQRAVPLGTITSVLHPNTDPRESQKPSIMGTAEDFVTYLGRQWTKDSDTMRAKAHERKQLRRRDGAQDEDLDRQEQCRESCGRAGEHSAVG